MINHLKWLGRSACLSTLLLANPLYANENDDLRQRLNELESIVIDMEAKMGGKAIANSFSSDNFDIGGYYHGVGREFDTDAGTAAGFTRNLLYLRIEADVSEKWSVSFGNLFGQVDLEQPELTDLTVDTDADGIPNYLDNFDVDLTGVITNVVVAAAGGTPSNLGVTPNQETNYDSLLRTQVTKLETFSLNFPVDVNVQYQHNDSLKATFGRQRAPIGYTSLYPMSWRGVELPRYMLGNNGVTNIFNPFVQGLAVTGQFFPSEGEHILNYKVFTGDTTASGPALKGDVTNEQSSARIGYARPDQSFSVGLNYIKGKREDRVFYGGNRFEATGIDIFAHIGSFKVVTEYYDSDEGDGAQPDRKGYTFQPTFSLTPQVEFVAIHDVVDAPLYQVANPAVTGLAQQFAAANPAFANAAAAQAVLTASGISATVSAPSNLGKIVENTVGFNYKPVENVRLRLLHSIRTYEDLGDYEVKITSLSATASF
jgi:hypothetical protein